MKKNPKKEALPEEENTLDSKELINWLMDEYGQMVVRLAYTYVKDKQIAEDVAQDVFIKCFQNLASFRHESSYKTWIYKITVNRCKDILKSWSVRNIFASHKVMEINQQQSASAEIESVIRENEQYITMKVLALPVKLRECIVLFYYEELAIDEIADLLKMKENTVKSRLHRARRKLKDMIGGEYLG